MTAAIIPLYGNTRQLDRRAEPREQIAEQEVQVPERLARRLTEQDRRIAGLERRWNARVLDFEDRTVDDTGATKYRLEHRFGGRVRYWVVDWSGGTDAPNLLRHADTDNNTLVLTSTVAGVATIRVEEAG